jgi:hypothetical protein
VPGAACAGRCALTELKPRSWRCSGTRRKAARSRLRAAAG